MDGYLLILLGGGDVIVSCVDKETWDWIHSDPCRPSDNPVIWEDPNVPDTLQTRILKEQNEGLPESSHESGISISSGSWQNDRAIMAPPIVLNGETLQFGSVSEAFLKVKKLKINLLNSYEGYIY